MSVIRRPAGWLLISSVVVLAGGCSRLKWELPSPEAEPREPMRVAAGFNETWYAVMNDFANRALSIETLDRTSGFISTGTLRVGAGFENAADCGTRHAMWDPEEGVGAWSDSCPV
jgi:hypothetical protein